MTCLDTYIDVLNCPEQDEVIVICSLTVYTNLCKRTYRYEINSSLFLIC